MSIHNRAVVAKPVVLDFVDPEITLIMNYVYDELAPAEAATVEARLETDAAFFAKALPLMEIYHMPVDYAEVERLAAQNAAELEPTNSVIERGTVVEPARVPSAGGPVGVLPLTQRRPPRKFTLSSFAKWAAGSTIAAGILAALVLTHDPDFQHLAAHGPQVPAPGLAVATSATSTNLRLSNLAQVSLRPHGFIGYSAEAPADGRISRIVRSVMPANKLTVFLTGSATFTLPRTAGIIDVVMTAGVITLEPNGIYEVRSNQAGTRTMVFVSKGRATLVPADKSAKTVILNMGEWATLNGGGLQ
jgi:hypothetical protein